MEKIVITGGFGFIGKNLIEGLFNNYNVVVIDKFIDNVFLKNNPELKYYEYDFFKNNQIHNIMLEENPDFVINLISYVNADRNINLLNDMIKINLDIMLKLYDATKDLKNLKLFLNFGSGEEYGNIQSPFKESDREYPNSPYSLSKQLTTNAAMMLNKNYDFPVAIVRPGNLFGKYQNENKFLPYIIGQLLKDEKIETTPGEQKRDFIYVDDFVAGIELIIKMYRNFIGEIVNLSSGISISLKDLILFCKEYMGSNSEIEFGKIPYRENEMMDFKLDINKFMDGIDGPFQADVKSGLGKYIGVMQGVYR